MRTYVTSLHGGAKRAHIGNEDWTACGTPLAEPFVMAEVPPNRVLCALCAASYGELQRDTPSDRRERVLVLLCEGKTTDEVAVELGMGLRTVVRHVSTALAQSGARTRFQMAYLIGYEIGRHDRANEADDAAASDGGDADD